MRAFEEAGAAIAPIYDIEQLMNDPQIEALAAVTSPSSVVPERSVRQRRVISGRLRAAPACSQRN